MLEPVLRFLSAVVLVLVLATGFLFAWYNDGTVQVDYLFGGGELRVAFLVFGAIAFGSAIGLAGGFAVFLQQRRELRRL